MQGYILQDDAESFLLLPCQVRSGCILTSLSVENISSSCANGYTGDYCVSCKNDWYFDPLTQSCEKTSSLQYQLVQPWVLTLVVWCLLFVVFEWTLYGSQSLSSRFTGVPNVESRKYVHGVLTLLLYTGQILWLLPSILRLQYPQISTSKLIEAVSFPWSSSRSAVVLSLTRFVQQWPLVFGEQLIISPVVELFCTVFMLILCFLVFISLKRVSAVARQGQKNVRVTESFNVNNAESPYLLCCSLTGTFETCAEWLCWLECALNIYFCEIVLYIGKCLSPCLELPNNREGSKKLSSNFVVNCNSAEHLSGFYAGIVVAVFLLIFMLWWNRAIIHTIDWRKENQLIKQLSSKNGTKNAFSAEITANTSSNSEDSNFIYVNDIYADCCTAWRGMMPLFIAVFVVVLALHPTYHGFAVFPTGFSQVGIAALWSMLYVALLRKVEPFRARWFQLFHEIFAIELVVVLLLLLIQRILLLQKDLEMLMNPGIKGLNAALWSDMWIGIDSAPLLIDGVITGVLGIVIVLLFLTIINAEAKVRGKVIEFRSFLTFFCTRRGSERGSARFAINAFGDEALRTTITCPVDVLALPRCSTIDSLPIHTAESAALSWEEEGKSTDDEYDEEKAIEISATNAEIFSLERNVHRGV